MALDVQHRDKNGEISRKHGNTLIGTLRKTYGVTREPDWKQIRASSAPS
jgi:hypothetical protein